MVAVVRLAPAPDPDVLREALGIVQRRHPLLAARIHKRRRRYTFVSDDGVPSIPLAVVTGAGPDDWLGAAETGLMSGLPADRGPLVAATLLCGDDAGDLVITIDHVVADATSLASMVDEMLASYAALSGGGPKPDLRPLPPPPVADDHFPAGFRGTRLRLRGAAFAMRTLLPEMRYRRSMRRAGGPKVHLAARSLVRTAELSAETTAALSRASRRRRLTVHSLIQAAVLSTLHERRYDGRPVVLRTMMFPDLRPYLDPPIDPASFACYLTAIFEDVTMNAGSDLWAVAADVQERVEGAVRGGGRFEAATMIAPVMRMVMATKKLRLANTAVSHTGATPLADRYGPLAVRQVHGFISHMPIGPELSVRAGTLHGRLTLDFQTLDTDCDRAELERLADGIVDRLLAAAS